MERKRTEELERKLREERERVVREEKERKERTIEVKSSLSPAHESSSEKKTDEVLIRGESE